MGVDFTAMLFYGMPIAGEVDYNLVDAFSESQDDLEIDDLSPMTDSRYVLFVRDSYNTADERSDEVLVALSTLTGNESV